MNEQEKVFYRKACDLLQRKIINVREFDRVVSARKKFLLGDLEIRTKCSETVVGNSINSGK